MTWPPRGRATVPETDVDGAPRNGTDGAAKRPVLVVLNGPQIGLRLALDESAIEIGRDPSCDLPLRDPGIAWRHARIEPGPEGWSVVDLGQHGVEVDGMRVAKLLLSAADRIQIGATVLRFELHGAVEQAFDAEVEERLWRDDLTGLMSRRKLELEVAARLDAARAGAGPAIGLAVIDLDRLKQINDVHGHLVGARVITEVGRVIGATVVAPAFACRLGGDEFAVALPGADVRAIEALAQRVLDAIAAMRVMHLGERLGVGASAGVAVGPAQGDEVFTLLRAADEALFRAKNEGRGVVRT
ncbi:GGDEF domain-containing protein [Sandaracinus amylolyticus]|uniref:GGDEF domain-containing protein n=1 Tax=Sandaracinus amylolyticus TaxID=927083 RepID=UPI001F00A942|nr:GGDEF domain-containing protein [Sandaracinus amylolyticus]